MRKFLGLLLLTGCSINHFNEDADRFNEKCTDRLVVKPVLKVYETFVPKPARYGVTNFLRNILMPITLCNNIFQGQFRLFLQNFTRFGINTTFGCLGLVDIVDKAGVAYAESTLNDTLKFYGASPGFFIVLPVLGPMCARQLTGLTIEGLAYSPLTHKKFLIPALYFEKRREFDYDFSMEIDSYLAKKEFYMQSQS